MNRNIDPYICDIMKIQIYFSCLKCMTLPSKKKTPPSDFFKHGLFPVESNLLAEAMKNFHQIFACVVLIPRIDFSTGKVW